MSLIEAMFAGMENAEGFGTGQYFDEGRFLVRPKAIKLVTSRRPENAGKHFFTVEFEVLESSNPAVEIGATRSYQVKIEGNQYAFADVKGFIAALIGLDPKNLPSPQKDPRTHDLLKKITIALCDEEYAKALPAADAEAAAILGELAGVPVKLEAFKKATRPKAPGLPGGVFTVHTWAPAEAAPAQ